MPMNETLWTLIAVFGLAVVAQLVAHFYRLRRSLRLLEQDVADSTQTIFESRRKLEWLEACLDDLLDAAQLGADDAQAACERMQQVSRRIRDDARHKGYRLGLCDIDQAD